MGYIKPITTKGMVTMQYKLTLNTRTTMVWLIMCTLVTLVCMIPMQFTTYGQGIYTLSMVGTWMCTIATIAVGITHIYVRTHRPITIKGL